MASYPWKHVKSILILVQANIVMFSCAYVELHVDDHNKWSDENRGLSFHMVDFKGKVGAPSQSS